MFHDAGKFSETKTQCFSDLEDVRKNTEVKGVYQNLRGEDSVLAKEPDPGICASNEGRF